MSLTPGLVPNIRLVQPEAEPQVVGQDTIVVVDAEGEGDKPVVDQKGNILKIEHDDGSISVSLDGQPIEKTKKKDELSWFDNIADEIDPMELTRIAEDLLSGIREDLGSREEWIQDRAQGLRLLGLKIELPGTQGSADGAPIEGMSKVRHPLLLEAVLRFQANARGEMLPTDGPVKIRDDSNSRNPQQDQLAEALERDFNHYLTAVAKEYYPDTDRMFFMLGFGGTAFKKVYFCPLRNRPVSESIDADELIVNNQATDLDNARRITHRIKMRPSVVKRMQIIGAYRDVDLGQPQPMQPDAVQQEKNQQQGVQADVKSAEDRDREIYECYCELDIKGFEHKIGRETTGLEVPYRVTIDVSSRQILSVNRNYDEDEQELPEAKKVFVKYTFVPGMGFYDIGLLHILGNTTNALTAAWRELLDAGMYSNFPGFLYAKAAGRQNSNIFRVPPGGGAQIDTMGMPINQAVMPLPYKEPSAGLMNFAENISQYGQRVGGTAEMAVGEGRQDAPVGTTLAIIEQAQKLLNAVHKRMHSAQSEEFQLLAQCFRDHPESFWMRNKKPNFPMDENIFRKALDNFMLVPQADPNTASHIQRVMKVTALIQLAQMQPQLYNIPEVNREALQILGWADASALLNPNPNATPPSPEAMAKMADAQAKQTMAQAKMMEAQAKVNDNTGKAPEPFKAAEIQLKADEIDQRRLDAQLDAINRKRDRESRERLATLKLAENLAQNPQGIGIADKIIQPGMLERLESNEPSLTVENTAVNK